MTAPSRLGRPPFQLPTLHFDLASEPERGFHLSILLKDATIVTMNDHHEVIRGDLLVDGDRIAAVGSDVGSSLNQHPDALPDQISRLEGG
jgi:hypothetical protein